MNATQAQVASSLDGLLSLWVSMDLREEFKSEIERLTKVRDDAQKNLGISKTVEDAARIKAQADEYAASQKISVDSALASAKARESDAKIAVERAVAAEKQAKSQSEIAIKLQDEYAKKDGELSRSMKQREASVQAREDAATAREAKIASDSADLARRVKSINENLQSSLK